jgi:hypothetical protein
MRWLKAIVAEIFGLFVDDGAFALATTIRLGVTWLVLPHLKAPTALGGIILFFGLALILVESTRGRSKR